MAIEVVLNVFSGRKNPSWALGLEEVAEFLTRLTAVRSRPVDEGQTGPKAPPLGYRGFKVRSTDGQDLPVPLEIYGGTARAGNQTYRDADRELEKWLLGTAPTFVSEGLLRRISQELEQQ